MGYGARFFKITKAAHEYTGQQLRQPVSTQGGDMSRSPLPCWPSRASGQGCSAGGVWGARGDGGAPVWEDGWQCGETESPARARLLLPRLCLSPDTSPSRIFKEVFTLVKKKKKHCITQVLKKFILKKERKEEPGRTWWCIHQVRRPPPPRMERSDWGIAPGVLISHLSPLQRPRGCLYSRDMYLPIITELNRTQIPTHRGILNSLRARAGQKQTQM